MGTLAFWSREAYPLQICTPKDSNYTFDIRLPRGTNLTEQRLLCSKTIPVMPLHRCLMG